MTGKTQLSIVTEAALEKAVVEEIVRLGADAYVTSEVRGRGPRQSDRWGPQEYRAVRVDVLCDSSVGEAIVNRLSERYFRGYSMTITRSEVSVLHSHPS